VTVAVGTKENALNIANANPCKQIATKINRGKTEDNAARETKGVMALLNELDGGIVRGRFEDTSGDARGMGGAGAVADAVDGGHDCTVGRALDDGQISRLDPPLRYEGGDAEVKWYYLSR
jgi:hypothetical protein